mgnify:CR=1 FL=1
MSLTASPSSSEPKPASPRLSVKPRRVRTPTVLQMEAVECGAACLAMVLGTFGRFVPLEVLRGECGVSRDGSKASSIVRVARNYGLKADGWKKEPHELYDLPLPLIVFWNFNHFVVVEGFAKDRIYLDDPASGPRTVSYDEFDQSFTGVVLTFEKTDGFEPGGRRSNLLASLGTRLRGSRVDLSFVVLAGLMLVLPGVVVPAFARVFIDAYLVKGRVRWVVPLLVGMGMTATARAALTWLQQKYLARLQTRMAIGTSSTFLWHVLRLPMDFFAQRYGGEVASRVGINDEVAELLTGRLATTVLSFVSVIFYAALMLGYDPLLTVIGISIACLNVAALRAVSGLRVDANRRLLQEQGKMLATAMGGLQIIETLKASGAESDFFSRWAGYQANVFNSSRTLSAYTRLLGFIGPLLSSLNTAAILGLGGWRVMQGGMTIGMLVAFQSLMASFSAPFNDIVSLGSRLQEMEGSLQRLDDVLAYPVDPVLANPSDEPPGKLEGRLELRGITFGYNRLQPPLISNFSISLLPGARVALVGGSGSGKSTLSRIIAGLYLPWAGEVLLDGRPRAALPRESITGSVGMVDQEIFLFEGTVRDNLTLWDRTIAPSDVQQAARDACIHDDIAARAGGYDSGIEEGGANFSGGQRQRLEIARALAINPTLLILDEATSALDAVTEKEIDDNLRRRGCTCVIVAHRLSTIRDCDEIIVLDRGRVVQRGTHDELVAVEGHYRTLIQAAAPSEGHS